MSESNDKVRDSYRSEGYTEEQITQLDLESLDSEVSWGVYGFAFPQFCEYEEVDSIEAYAFTGCHTSEGWIICKYTFVVGEPDPRDLIPEAHEIQPSVVKRLIVGTTPVGNPLVLLDLDCQTSERQRVRCWPLASTNPQTMLGELLSTYGQVPSRVIECWDVPWTTDRPNKHIFHV